VTREPLVLDGGVGEGGGQILRTAVALSAALGTPVTVRAIRPRRSPPGLRAQHLAAVRAAAAVCDAECLGAEIGSSEITFRPQSPRSGRYEFDVGTAGSAALVCQTVLPALMLTEGDSTVTVAGGTHNPLAPCFEYLRDVFALPASAANLQAYFAMDRAGFYPAGGGEMTMQVRGVESVENLSPLRLTSPGTLRYVEGLSAASAELPRHVVERQLAQALGRLAKEGLRASIEEASWETRSPGTVVFLRAVFTQSVGGAFALGERGKPAERVADEATDALLAFLRSGAALDAHAADQLLTLAALCPHESQFTAERVTSHLETNAEVVRRMTGRAVHVEGAPGKPARVTVEGL